MKAPPSPSQRLSLMPKVKGNNLNFSKKLENRQHMRKRMKFVWKARHVAIINDIPIDIVIEILARLPSKTLSRFKSVCKLWHSIIQSRGFILHHLHYNKSKASSDLNFITLFLSSVREYMFSLTYFVKDGQDPHNFQIRDKKVDYTSNSCNGLICVYGTKHTYVVNPSIEEYVKLPKAPPVARYKIMIALAYDARTEKYKVIRTYGKIGNSSGCMIFTLGSSTSWRFIEEIPYQICQSAVPVVVNDTIYFGVHHDKHDNGPEIGVSLSIKSETFDKVMHPNYTPGASSQIYEVGGDLCLLDTIDPRFETLQWPPLKIMWTLKDNTWIKHDMDLKSMEDLTRGESCCLDLVGIRDGKIMTSTCGGRLDFYDRALQRFEKPLKKNHKRAVPYTESLISPVAIMKSTMERDV